MAGASGRPEADGPLPRVSLHLFEGFADHESRFQREAKALLDAGLADRIVVLARARSGPPGRASDDDRIQIVRLPLRSSRLPANKLLAIIKVLESHWRFSNVGAATPGVVSIHCHGLTTLTAASSIKRRLRVPLVYAPHELETERNGLAGVRQWLDRQVERHWIGASDAVVCVSDSIADWYATRYGIARPTVVRNVPDADIPLEGTSALRTELSLGPDALIFLYQGGLFRGRRIEMLLEAFRDVPPPRHLVFMGYGECETAIRDAARRQSNVHFLPAVPPEDVLRYTAGADVGICGVENVCLSYFFALPNKLFEYIRAGIGTLAPDYPEMRRVLEDTNSGWLVGETLADWHTAFATLGLDAIAIAKSNSREARTRIDWPLERARLLDLYHRVLA